MQKIVSLFLFIISLSASYQLLAYETNPINLLNISEESEDSSDEEGEINFASTQNDTCFYLKNPRRCQRDANCEWNPRLYRCVKKGDTSIQTCDAINSRVHCERRLDCTWLGLSRRCITKSLL